eukprot:CAMPEP_0197246170 /NCGR_PEP_ID=MMETSP1429-20130617/10712_1 /TAXON_ID=49237 /ORGANISM="Chaetoceros  sp., Strain UNC1202" /LENGTH=102 /DNA_ID=CAMNT_0042706781 /DNA_START=19 /DNA_END=323 /DNA_ORIENTATION=-
MVYSDGTDEWQHKVLGIALVAEEIGKLSKLVFRYPPSPQHGPDADAEDQSNIPSNTSASNSTAKRNRSESSTDQNVQNEESEQKENIFFTLPPRVMAKLFRT